MQTVKTYTYNNKIPQNQHYVLAADIGGTNSNFGLCSIDNNTVSLYVSYHVKSKSVIHFPTLIKQVLDYFSSTYNITIKHACIAGAGVLHNENKYIKPTNLSIVIGTEAIKHATNLKTVLLVNDFQVIGKGIKYIDPKNIITIKTGTEKLYATQAIIGAGTGLGKAILYWDQQSKNHKSAFRRRTF